MHMHATMGSVSGLVIALLLFAPAHNAQTLEGNAPKPHILFVLVDDLGWGNVGFNRAAKDKTPEVATPNLDGLVAEGIHLTRHYVHQYCTPTRTSVQSGRLPVRVNTGLGDPCSDGTGISQNMTGMAEKLKLAGYTTAMAGKWDAGMATPAHTPHGRGYDTSLNYFSHKNDFWSQANMQTCCQSDQTIIDFWETDKGASDLNNTGYSEFLYQTHLLDVINKQDTEDPLMLFYAPHVAHCPLQVPKANFDKFGFMKDDEGKCSAQTVKGVHTIDPHFPDLPYKCRQQYHAMVNIMDGVVGNLTSAMKAKGMWDNTLVVMSSDNGGPVDLAENAANNWPLRGGKYSLFEGGIRATAFVSGGFVPQSLRGTVQNGIVHIADWYATFSNLAGVDPTDARAAAANPPVPPIDSIDMWPFLSGQVSTSPRTIVPIGSGCIVVGDFKLILGKTSPNFWQGPNYPNASSVSLASDGWTVNGWSEPRPARPYVKLAPCEAGNTLQVWDVNDEFSSSEICSQDKSVAAVPCWNIQGAHNSEDDANIILWPRTGTTNELFNLKSGVISSPAGGLGCVAPSESDSMEVFLTDKCNSGSWNFTNSQLRWKQATGEELCATAFLNGTTPPPPPPPAAPWYLFNVAADPTEQINLANDSQYETLIANMTAELTVQKQTFFQNHDTFTNNCPTGTKDCACWMAKNRYGGFMGPYAMLN